MQFRQGISENLSGFFQKAKPFYSHLPMALWSLFGHQGQALSILSLNERFLLRVHSASAVRAECLSGGEGMSAIKQRWQQFAGWYTRFIERQGFLVILTACVAVIAGTAAWTNRTNDAPPAPTLPVGDAASAARQWQQSLQEASLPTPSPAPSPPVQWQAPLEQLSVITSFDAARLRRSETTGLWVLHDAIDLRCAAGEQILAMADGQVAQVSKDGLWGACVVIDHGQGILAQYAGMAMTAGLREGDPVQAGQVIGFGGNNTVEEKHLEPHLHLRVTREGQTIDPMTLLAR